MSPEHGRDTEWDYVIVGGADGPSPYRGRGGPIGVTRFSMIRSGS